MVFVCYFSDPFVGGGWDVLLDMVEGLCGEDVEGVSNSQHKVKVVEKFTKGRTNLVTQIPCLAEQPHTSRVRSDVPTEDSVL